MALRRTQTSRGLASVGGLFLETEKPEVTGKAVFSHRWDLGEYAISGPWHADQLGAWRGAKAGRAGAAGFGYEKWRKTYQVRHLPQITRYDSYERAGVVQNGNILSQIRGNDVLPVTPRLYTAEELESHFYQSLKNQLLQIQLNQVPLRNFYHEKAWTARYARANKKERAERDLLEAARRGIKGQETKLLTVTELAEKRALRLAARVEEEQKVVEA